MWYKGKEMTMTSQGRGEGGHWPSIWPMRTTVDTTSTGYVLASCRKTTTIVLIVLGKGEELQAHLACLPLQDEQMSADGHGHGNKNNALKVAALVAADGNEDETQRRRYVIRIASWAWGRSGRIPHH